VEFTGLAPRHHLSASAAAGSEVGAAAAPACPHTHFGEVWSGGTGRGLWVGTTTIQSALIGVNVPTKNSGSLGQDDSGVFAVAQCTDCDGVEAISYGGHGVEGTTLGNWSNRSGVYGEAIQDQANGVTGWHTHGGPGVYAYSSYGTALIARGADDGNFTARKGDLELRGSYGDILAPGFLRLWSDLDAYVTLDANNDGSNSFIIFNGNGQAVFSVNEAGNTWARGSKGAVVEAGSYGDRKLYAVESPEVWFEDFGSAQLLNGQASVPIEPVFAETVALDRDYHVFLTPLGDCQGLYVAAKHPAAFEVRELGGGMTSLAFDYRIVARRRGFEDVRLESLEPGVQPGFPVEGEP
jgi:hypothetical protein